MSLWIRKLTCVIDSIVVKDLRVEFRVTKTISGTPNEAVIRIYNLKESNRAQIKDEFKHVLLDAGYRDDTTGVIFTGEIRTVTNMRVSATDIVTEITAAEADISHRFSYINRTFSPEETAVENVIKELQQRMDGVRLGQLVGLEGLPKLKRYWTVVGSVYKELNKLCKKHNLYWSVQNGFLEVIAHDKYIDSIVVISAKTGMVGVPDPTELGVDVTTLMNHRIAPNRLIQVDSSVQASSGMFRVNEVDYHGNNIDGRYICAIKGATLQQDGVKHEKYKKDI